MISLPKIKDREDEDPDQIDEVPIQTQGFDDLVVALSAGQKARSHGVQIAPQDLDRGDDQENHADRHVRAVESGDHEEARAELGRTHWIAPGTYPLMHDQLGPLERLHPDERGAQSCRQQQQYESLCTVLAIPEV